MKEFSSIVRKILRKSYKPAVRNFMVRIDSKGIKNKEGYYYTVDGKTMILKAVVMFNALNDEKSADIRDSWNPLFNERIKGKAGLGILVSRSYTRYSEILPIDAKTVTEFKEFKGIANCSAKIFSSKPSNVWQMRFKETFKPEDLENLLKQYNEMVKSVGEKIKIFSKNPRDLNYDKKTWIERGYPCAYRYGLSYRGAKAEPIDKNSALQKFEHTFESKYEKINNIWHLVLQDYSANDMW